MVGINSNILQGGSLTQKTSTMNDGQNIERPSSNSVNTNKASLITTVTLSSEARKKLAQEEQSIKENINQKLKDSAMKNITESKPDSDLDVLDKMIEQVQEKIKEIQRKLRSLHKENAKESRQEQKMLNAQLMSLNNSLINLYGKKLQAIE